jgi:predicted Zn-dependent protease with MMP-like domain
MKLTRAEFEKLVDEALSEIPERLRPYLDGVIIEVESMPDERTCREAEIDDPHELLGYYQGTPLTDRSIDDTFRLPDRITLYQRNIEDICEDREEVVEEIRITVLHEVGHHFGLDEDDLDELGYA